MPDYVQQTLDFLGANWNTANYDPQPDLYDGRDMSRESDGKRDVSHDLSDNAAITVGGQPGVDKTPEGLAWEFDRVDAGVRVRIEAAHGGRGDWGGIDDASEFETLVDEAKRCLEVERKRPMPGYYRLEVRSVEDESSNYGDYYRTDLVAAYVGLEQLP